MSSANSFVDEIEKFIASGKVRLPAFHPNALKVQQELVKDEPRMSAVEQMIIRDQALASEVLRIANSSYYRGLAEVKTVKAAIVRLGMQEVGRIVLLAASRNQYRSKDREINRLMVKLWQHSAGTGLAANWLSRRCNYPELGGQAFFSALLHDIGKLFILTAIEQSKIRETGRMTWPLLMEVLYTLHTQEGFRLMQQWNMPANYCEIVRDHHEPEADVRNTLMLLIRLSDLACNKLGIGLYPPSDINLAATFEANQLELGEIDMAELEIMLEDTRILTM